MTIDVFSKYGWIVPLKDKKGETITKVFQSIFKEGRKPKYLWTDKGSEFYNKHFKDLLKKHNIHCIRLKMKKSHQWWKGGTVRLKIKCGNDSLPKAIQCIWIFCLKY